MSDMLQITTPVLAKNYNLTSHQVVQNQEIFDLVDLSKVIKTSDRSEQFREKDNAFDENSGIPKMPMLISKEPRLLAMSLKLLFSTEIIATLRETGNLELLNKLTAFASEILLSPDKLLADLQSQHIKQTSFNGDMFDILRTILSQTGNVDVKTAINSLLKWSVTATSTDEILKSLASNMNFLADQLSPSRSLSATLLALAEQLSAPNAADNFSQIKSNILSILHDVSNSILLTDKTKNILPLVTYNLSRFNDNSSALKESFNNLIDLFSNKDLKDALSKAFNNFVENSNLPIDAKLLAVTDSSTYQRVVMEKQMTQLVMELAGKTNQAAKTINANDLKAALSKIFTDEGATSIKNILSQLFDLGSKPISPPTLALTTGELLQQQASGIDTSTGQSGIATGTGSPQSPTQFSTPLTNLGNVLEVFSGGAEGSAATDVNKILNNFMQTKDLNALVGKLSVILNSIDDLEVKITLATSLNQALEQLATSEQIQYKPPSSMENLVSFLSKNMEDVGLRSLTSFNQSEIVQNMLTAPGIFTPLLHYLVPLQFEDIRAFGELWVDNDAANPDKKNGSEGESNHLYLSFTVENIGDFELEILTKKTDISISLMCPPGLTKTFSKLRDSIAKIAVRGGYSPKNTIIEPLIEKRNLVDIFPRIREKRMGLNVKI